HRAELLDRLGARDVAAVDEEGRRRADAERRELAAVGRERRLAIALEIGLELVHVEAELGRPAVDVLAAVRVVPALYHRPARSLTPRGRGRLRLRRGVQRDVEQIELAGVVALVPEQAIHLHRLALLGRGAERERADRRLLGVDDELLVDDADILAVLLLQ